MLIAAIGAGVSYKYMGMARVDAFYFALSSTTATGYGDFTPEELTQIYQEIWEFLESVGVKTTVD